MPSCCYESVHFLTKLPRLPFPSHPLPSSLNVSLPPRLPPASTHSNSVLFSCPVISFHYPSLRASPVSSTLNPLSFHHLNLPPSPPVASPRVVMCCAHALIPPPLVTPPTPTLPQSHLISTPTSPSPPVEHRCYASVFNFGNY